jgi:hypothetical protein
MYAASILIRLPLTILCPKKQAVGQQGITLQLAAACATAKRGINLYLNGGHKQKCGI